MGQKVDPDPALVIFWVRCSLAQVKTPNGVRTSGVKWTSWSVRSEISGRAQRSEIGLRVTSVFVEENGDLEVAAGQDPEPRGTGAESTEQSGKYGNVMSPPKFLFAIILVDISFTNNFAQCLGGNLLKKKSRLTLFDICKILKLDRIVVRHEQDSFVPAPFSPYGPGFQSLFAVQNIIHSCVWTFAYIQNWIGVC